MSKQKGFFTNIVCAMLISSLVLTVTLTAQVNAKQKIAEEIFQEISENERNFEKLSLLKQRAINELNLTF